MSKPGTGDMLNAHRAPERFGQYKIVDFLGKGAVGKVYKGADMNSGDFVAMKVVDLHALQVEDLGDVQNEVKLLKRFKHPNIVNYVDALRTDTHLCIVLEFMERGSLSQFIARILRQPEKTSSKGGGGSSGGGPAKPKTPRNVRKKRSATNGRVNGVKRDKTPTTPRQTSAEARFLELKQERLESIIDMDQHEQLVAGYTSQLLLALEYLHQQGVIHRDIKAANVLLGRNGMVKVADFGVATKLQTKKGGLNMDVVGTPYWMAPEIIEMVGEHTTAVDIWSVGCTVIELLTGYPPYFDLQQMPAMFCIVHDDHPPFPSNLSPVATDFLRKCFSKDPKERPTAAELLKHEWVASHVIRVKKDIVEMAKPVEESSGEVEVRLLSQNSNELREKSVGFVDCETSITLQVLRRKVVQELDHVPENFSFVYNFAFPGVTVQSLPAAMVRKEVEKFQRVRHCLHKGCVRLCDPKSFSNNGSDGSVTQVRIEEQESNHEDAQKRARQERRDAYKRSQSVGRPSRGASREDATPSAERQQRARVLYNLLKSQQTTDENVGRRGRRKSRGRITPRTSDSDSADHSSSGPQAPQSYQGRRGARPKPHHPQSASYTADGMRKLRESAKSGSRRHPRRN